MAGREGRMLPLGRDTHVCVCVVGGQGVYRREGLMIPLGRGGTHVPAL